MSHLESEAHARACACVYVCVCERERNRQVLCISHPVGVLIVCRLHPLEGDNLCSCLRLSGGYQVCPSQALEEVTASVLGPSC